MKNVIQTLAGLFLLIIFGVFYNYFQSKAALRHQNFITPINIKFLDPPSTGTLNQPVQFNWEVTSPSDKITTDTTIFWDYVSSPSALTITDSPQAAGYHYSQPDYRQGRFNLPDKFDLNINFDHPGRIYLRAYTLIDSKHYWTPEIAITVNNK